MTNGPDEQLYSPSGYPPPNPQRRGLSKTGVLLIAAGIIIALCVGGYFLFFNSNRTSTTDSVNSVPTSADSSLPAGMLSEIQTFLESHEELGRPIGVEALSDWSQGARQRVYFDTRGKRRSLLFHIKDGQVVTVYEEGPDSRTKIWVSTDRKKRK